MVYPLDVSLHGLPSIPRIRDAYRAGQISRPDFVRAFLGRYAQDRADPLSDDDPGRGRLLDFASDIEDWFLYLEDALPLRP
jgi:hypothetical protein